MKKIIQKLKNIIMNLINLIKNCIMMVIKDKALFIFIIGIIIPNLLLKITSDMKLFNIKSFAMNLTWLCLFSLFSYGYKKGKTRVIYYTIILSITYLITYGNILYFRYYQSFLSLSLMKQVRLFADVSDAALIGISVFDLIYWCIFGVTLILLVLVNYKFTNTNSNKENSVKYHRSSFLKLAVISFAIGLFSLSPANYSQFYKLWNRPIVVENFGLYNYHIVDSIRSLSIFFEPQTSDEDYQYFLDYFNQKNQGAVQNQYTDIFKDKNVIVIHAESVEQFLVNLEINGQVVTPNLNKIANTGFYFSNFYSQESIGTSSDSEFVFNTSLLPVNNGTIFLTNFNNKYNSTPELLRNEGYYTASMHGNNGTYWNRHVMHPNLGYDFFYEKLNTYNPTEEQVIGLGISDLDFFNESVEIIDGLDTKFFLTMITLTNHTPFAAYDKYITYDEFGNESTFDCGDEITNSTMCGYLKSVHYADYAFGEFMKSLDERGILEDTIIVLYGDHPAKLPREEMEKILDEELTAVEYKAKQRVPFIIWSKDIEEPVVVDKVMGMMDSGPTLQNMLGIKNEFALGNDIFSIEENFVPFVNGDWTDGKVFYDMYRNDYFIYDESQFEEVSQTEDFDLDKYIKLYIEEKNIVAEEIVTISNLINRYNMLKYHEEQLNKVTYDGIGG